MTKLYRPQKTLQARANRTHQNFKTLFMDDLTYKAHTKFSKFCLKSTGSNLSFYYLILGDCLDYMQIPCTQS